MAKITFYNAGGMLIQYNSTTDRYTHRNTLNKNTAIEKDEFDKLTDKVVIKKHQFRELVNEFFRNAKVYWTHDGYNFKKLPCFSEDGNCYDSAGEIICSIFNNRKPVVYFNNKLYAFYYHNPRVCLLDFKSRKSVGWCSVTNLSTIWNKDLKEVVYYNNV